MPEQERSGEAAPAWESLVDWSLDPLEVLGAESVASLKRLHERRGMHKSWTPEEYVQLIASGCAGTMLDRRNPACSLYQGGGDHHADT